MVGCNSKKKYIIGLERLFGEKRKTMKGNDEMYKRKSSSKTNDG